MLILEIITEFLIEVVFIDTIGGGLSKVNNAILKLRGVKMQSTEGIKFGKMKRRYEHKSVSTRSTYNEIKKGKHGVVLELIDKEFALVEFGDIDKIVRMPIKTLSLRIPTN